MASSRPWSAVRVPAPETLSKGEVEWGPCPKPVMPTHIGLGVRPGVRTFGGYFHALTLAFFVFFIILVRSGCDMGNVCVFGPV